MLTLMAKHFPHILSKLSQSRSAFHSGSPATLTRAVVMTAATVVAAMGAEKRLQMFFSVSRLDFSFGFIYDIPASFTAFYSVDSFFAFPVLQEQKMSMGYTLKGSFWFLIALFVTICTNQFATRFCRAVSLRTKLCGICKRICMVSFPFAKPFYPLERCLIPIANSMPELSVRIT